MMSLDLSKIDIDYPVLYSALETDMRLLGLDPSFKPNKILEKKITNLKLHINDEEACFTNFLSIFVGKKAPFFKGDINERFNIARTIIGHEMGHVRLTSKSDWDRFVYTAPRNYGLLSNYAKDVLNILEDRRIERGMSFISEFLKENFFLLNYRMVKNISKQINEAIASSHSIDVLQKLEIILSCLLYMSVMRSVPKIDNPEIMSILKKCLPYVLYARTSNHTSHVVGASKKILEILKPLIDEFNDTFDFKLKAMFLSKDVGSESPTDISELEQYGDGSEMVSFSEEIEEEIKKQVQKAKEEIEEGKENEVVPSSSSSGEKENEEEIQNEGEKETSSGEKSKDSEQTSSSSAQDTSDGFENETPKEMDLKEHSTIRSHTEDIAGNLDNARELEGVIEGKIKKIEQKLQHPITQEILHDLLDSKHKVKKQSVKEYNEKLKIENLASKINVEAHKGCKSVFKEKGKMQNYSRKTYDNITTELNPVIKKTIRQIQEISQETIENTQRFQRTGRLDRKSLLNFVAFEDPKIFKQKEFDKRQLEMEVMLLVDVSGSNGAQMLNKKNDTYIPRYQMNQTVAILLHEVLKGLRFKHSIWTFHETFGAKVESFSNIMDRSNCFDKDVGLLLREIDAYGENRDGYAIRVAGEYLNSLKEVDKRLLIVLSDGQPAASGYGGSSAMADVKAAVEDVEKKGSKVVGIFTGHESENRYFKEMYPNRIFCNNESIFDLPKEIKNLLIKEFQEHLSKI